jgi:hypothetical protein
MTEKHKCAFNITRKSSVTKTSEISTSYYCVWCGKRLDKKIYPINAAVFSYANPEDLV